MVHLIFLQKNELRRESVNLKKLNVFIYLKGKNIVNVGF